MASIVGIIRQFINKRQDNKTIDELIYSGNISAGNKNKSIAEMIDNISFNDIKTYIDEKLIDTRFLAASDDICKALISSGQSTSERECGTFTPLRNGFFRVLLNVSNSDSSTRYAYLSISYNSGSSVYSNTFTVAASSNNEFAYDVPCSKNTTYTIKTRVSSNYVNISETRIGATVMVETPGT